MANSQSTVTLQALVDIAQAFGDLEPILNVGGQTLQPALTAANDTMNAIAAASFPWKFFEMILPVFYTNSYQQDYTVVNADGSSLTGLSWLERGIVLDINNTSQPKPFRNIETGREIGQATASVGGFGNYGSQNPMFYVNWFPNYMLYYGVWGQPNTGGAANNTAQGMQGNNPVANSVYTNPVGATSQPANPITQIKDANGNLLLLTTYGHEGSAAPLAALNAAAGTLVPTSGSGGTTVWTVVDPNGYGFRVSPVPYQTGNVWQFNIVGQMKPVRFTSFAQTLAPLPDEMEPHFRQGFIAQLYRYSPEAKVRAKFKEEWPLWLKSLNEMRSKNDREQEENRFVPARGVMGGRQAGNWWGPAWPFNGPPGW